MKPPDGTYEFENGILTALRAIDPARLRQVRDVLREATREQITPEHAAKQVITVAPELQAVLARLADNKASLVWVQTLLTALGVVLSWMALHNNTLKRADHEALQRDIRTAIEQVHQSTTPPLQPGSTITLPRPKQAPRPSASKPRTKRPAKTYGASKRRKGR